MHRSQLDWRDIVAHIRATARSDTVCVVRIASYASISVESAASEIKRALDIGADGVMIPNVETVDQLRALIGYTRYPPEVPQLPYNFPLPVQ